MVYMVIAPFVLWKRVGLDVLLMGFGEGFFLCVLFCPCCRTILFFFIKFEEIE